MAGSTINESARAEEVPERRRELEGGVTALNGRRDHLANSLERFTSWHEGFGDSSWDHQSFFGGTFGSRAKALYYRNRMLGILAVSPMIFCEAFFPAGRRLFHRPMQFPIADAHYAMGYAFLFQSTGTEKYFERCVHFLEELERTRSPLFDDYCWGYPFDWVTRNGVFKKDIPLITSLPYMFEAFHQAYSIDPRKEWKEAMRSMTEHACHDIPDFELASGSASCGYHPFDEKGMVVNASAYRASMLMTAWKFFGEERYRGIADRNIDFVLESQREDGSWFYAMDGEREFVDHFHTCFVMKGLAKVHAITGDRRILEALSRGIDYYLANLFDEEGMPRPFARAPRLTVYRNELYDCAECINLCLLLRDRFPVLEDTLTHVVSGIFANWIKPDGSFRSRRLILGWDNVPMHRWAQSQMFRALAYLLSELKGRENDPAV